MTEKIKTQLAPRQLKGIYISQIGSGAHTLHMLTTHSTNHPVPQFSSHIHAYFNFLSNFAIFKIIYLNVKKSHICMFSSKVSEVI